MASVIHALWVRGDQSPLILPGSVPLDDTAVVSELDRNLNDNWKPIIDADVSKISEFMGNRPHPGKDNPKGHFGFAGHNDPVEFRNIKIKRLESSK